MNRKIRKLYCASLDCDRTPDRTVIWERDGRPFDYSHECGQCSAESHTVPGMYPGAVATVVLAGLRDPFQVS